MINPVIPFQISNWERVPESVHPGETGTAYWKTLQLGNLRIRQVTYSPGYRADHWCMKGHIVYCLEGELTTELSDGQCHRLTKNMSYQVSDGLSSHRSITEHGAVLLIIDGEFLADDQAK